MSNYQHALDSNVKYCIECKHYVGGNCSMWLDIVNKNPAAAAGMRASNVWCGPYGSQWERKEEVPNDERQ